MPRPLKCRPWAGRGRQCGQALLILLAILAMGVIAILYTSVRPASLSIEREKATAAALAQVKEALIGWSAQRTSSVSLPNARPGELPCPDSDNDGFEDGTCVAGAIGRVPWKTLGIPKPKDDAGETLWYAIAGPFRIWNVNPNPINSDTKGNITVYRETTATVVTNEAVAILFSPGPAFGAQNRGCPVPDCDNYVCPPPASSTALCNPANYLDTAAGINNATPIGNPPPVPSFISAQRSMTFNDRVLVITAADVITVVEKRVAREMLALLQSYRTAPANTCACYTWADDDFTNEGDDNAFRGWLPLGIGDPHDWGPDLGIAIPAWLSGNDWWKVVYYAVAPNESQNKSGGTLTVDGASGTNIVLITPGPAAPGVPRPVNAPGTPAYWAEYLKDAQNADHANNTYVTPTSTAYARNRLYKIP